MTIRPRNIDLTILPKIFPKRKFIFITARSVAMGTPSSYMLKGMIECLLDKKDKQISKDFFSQFTIVFLPFLNIDGVKAGQTVLNGSGNLINNLYKDLNTGLIGKLVNLTSEIQKTSKIYSFIDLDTKLHT